MPRDIIAFLWLTGTASCLLLLVACAPPPRQYSPVPTMGPGYLPAYPDRQELEAEWTKAEYHHENAKPVSGR